MDETLPSPDHERWYLAQVGRVRTTCLPPPRATRPRPTPLGWDACEDCGRPLSRDDEATRCAACQVVLDERTEDE